MLAKLVAEIPPGMYYEPKWDGFRAIVVRDGDTIEIRSRNGKPMARYFPDLVAAFRAQLPARCAVDGEIVVITGDRLDFFALQQRVHPAASRVGRLAAETPASFIAFDLLDDPERPFAERRAALEAMAWAPPLHLTPITRDERVAREVAERRRMQLREQEMQRPARANLEQLFEQVKAGQLPELPIIIKGDVQGSVEALRGALEKLSRPEVRLNVVHAAVGGITKTDVDLAAAANAIIIGFNVRPDATARKVAEQENVDIRLYRVIYEAIEEMEKALVGMLEPEYREVVIGRAEVRALFKVPNVGTVAGCYVTEGKIVRGASMRVIRDGTVVHEGAMSSLKRFKDDVREVAQGYECGIGLERFNDLKEGDILEAFRMEEVARES